MEQTQTQHSIHRRGHTFFAIGASLWLAMSVLVSLPPRAVLAVATSDVFSLSNTQRVNNGLAALNPSSKLNSAAQAKAQHMRDNNYFAHTAPDGTTGWSFISSSGYSYKNAGENLAAGNQGANAVVQGWMNSSGHRANLLSSTFTEVGYGSTFVGNWEYGGETYADTYFVVALYALPTASAPAPAPEPEPEPVQPASAPTQQTSQSSGSGTAQSQSANNQSSPSNIEEVSEEIIEEEPEPEAIDEGLSDEQKTSESTPGVASVAEVSTGSISPSIAIFMGLAGSSAIVFGAYKEVLWLKHHAHINIHKS